MINMYLYDTSIIFLTDRLSDLNSYYVIPGSCATPLPDGSVQPAPDVLGNRIHHSRCFQLTEGSDLYAKYLSTIGIIKVFLNEDTIFQTVYKGSDRTFLHLIKGSVATTTPHGLVMTDNHKQQVFTEKCTEVDENGPLFDMYNKLITV